MECSVGLMPWLMAPVRLPPFGSAFLTNQMPVALVHDVEQRRHQMLSEWFEFFRGTTLVMITYSLMRSNI